MPTPKYTDYNEPLDIGDLIACLDYDLDLDRLVDTIKDSNDSPNKFGNKRDLSHRNTCNCDEHGVEITFYKNTKKELGNDNIALYCYGLKDPVIDLGPNKLPLYAMFSSMEYENEQLLHFLLNKSKNKQ